MSSSDLITITGNQKQNWRGDLRNLDLLPRVFVVTGASTDIGYETTMLLVKTGAKVYALGKSSLPNKKSTDGLHFYGPYGHAVHIHCNMHELRSTRSAAERILAMETEVRI